MKLSPRIFAISLLVLLGGCSSGNSYQGDTPRNSYDKQEETGNPYDEGSGHNAGYEWAERTGGNCNGNSASFNEGCEEYYRQNSR